MLGKLGRSKLFNNAQSTWRIILKFIIQKGWEFKNKICGAKVFKCSEKNREKEVAQRIG